MTRRKTVSVAYTYRMKQRSELGALRARTEFWQTLKEQGDIKILSKHLGISPASVTIAIKYGRGNLWRLRRIDRYFQKRAEQIIHEQKN